MVKDILFSVKDRYERHQGESEYQNYDNESDHATDFGGPCILLLIEQGCPILPNRDLTKPGEPIGALNCLLLFCFSGRDLGGF